MGDSTYFYNQRQAAARKAQANAPTQFQIQTGFKDQAAQDLNRALRNQIEQKAASVGMSNQAAYGMAKGNLTDNSVLQDVWNRIGQGGAKAPPPTPKAAPAPQPSPESDRYRKEAESYMKQAQDMLNQFKIEQQRAAEAARLAEEMRIKSQATAAANMARSQQAPNLQIEPASGTPDTAGTQGFKRRKGPQLMTKGSPFSALNIGSSNLMNV